MNEKYIVFGKLGQYIVTAESWVRAIQIVIAKTDSVAFDWNSHIFNSYPEKLQIRIINDSRTIIL